MANKEQGKNGEKAVVIETAAQASATLLKLQGAEKWEVAKAVGKDILGDVATAIFGLGGDAVSTVKEAHDALKDQEKFDKKIAPVLTYLVKDYDKKGKGWKRELVALLAESHGVEVDPGQKDTFLQAVGKAAHGYVAKGINILIGTAADKLPIPGLSVESLNEMVRLVELQIIGGLYNRNLTPAEEKLKVPSFTQSPMEEVFRVVDWVIDTGIAKKEEAKQKVKDAFKKAPVVERAPTSATGKTPYAGMPLAA